MLRGLREDGAFGGGLDRQLDVSPRDGAVLATEYAVRAVNVKRRAERRQMGFTGNRAAVRAV